MVELNITEILTITFSFLAISISTLSLINSCYYNKKTLRQSEKNLKIQLIHNDVNNAIRNLHRCVIHNKNKSFGDFEKDVNDYLDSYEGLLVPNNIRKLIKSNFSDLNKKSDDFYSFLKQPEPSDEEILKHEEEVYEEKMSMEPHERFELELKDDYGRAIDSIIFGIKKEINIKRKNPVKLPIAAELQGLHMKSLSFT